MTEPQAAPKKRTARKKTPSRTVKRADVPKVPEGLRPPKILDRAKYQPDVAQDRTVAEVIAFLIRKGMRADNAAMRVGVYPVTFKAWVQRGIQEVSAMETENRDEPSEMEAPFVWFASMVMQARAEWEENLGEKVATAAKKDWRGLLAWARHVDPDTFADQSKRVEVTGAGGGPIQTANIPTMGEVAMVMAQLPPVPS